MFAKTNFSIDTMRFFLNALNTCRIDENKVTRRSITHFITLDRFYDDFRHRQLSISSSLVSSTRRRRQLDVLRAHICRTSKLQVSARVVFFSETRCEGVGDRAKEREKKGKERVERCERERNGENERERKRTKKRTGKRREGRFTAAGKRQECRHARWIC